MWDPRLVRGLVLEAFRDDTTGDLTFSAYATHPLPIELVEQFIAEARHQLALSSP